MIFKGKLNYEKQISGILKKYNKKNKPNDYAGKIIYLKHSINSILDYFQFIKGIILEEGGILSHVAIVSREFNIPSIIGINVNDLFLEEAHVKLQKNKLIFTTENYLVPSKNFVKLFKKEKNYYLIYKDTKKIVLDKDSFGLIKDLQKYKLKEIYKKFGNGVGKFTDRLVTDKIFCFSTTKTQIPYN